MSHMLHTNIISSHINFNCDIVNEHFLCWCINMLGDDPFYSRASFNQISIAESHFAYIVARSYKPWTSFAIVKE